MKSKEKIMEKLNIEKLPKKWEGGRLKYDPYRKVNWRTFVNYKRKIAIVSSEENDGIVVEKINWEDIKENWDVESILFETTEEKNDEEKTKKAIEFMKKINEGKLEKIKKQYNL